MAEDKTIVSRIQHRRGLKQDLPQPLRAGEIGLAVDSRQVFIGGDSNNPQNVDFNSISYIENTAGAKTHTTSIANNNIIAFQVPYIKYKRGDFDSIINSHSWFPSNPRSTDASTKAGQKYNSLDHPVFSSATTSTVSSTVYANTVGTTTIYVTKDAADGTASDTLGNIRVGDIVSGTEIVGTPIVDSVAVNSANDFIITVNSAQTLTANSAISFTPKTIKNYVTGGPFTSTEVVVKKNGIEQIAESNPALYSPSAVADYSLNASAVTPGGIHTLKLRTAPTSSDEVTVCYYSNANVISAFEGVGNKIAVSSSISSFYDAYSIPEYRKIPSENVRVSTETGLGYIALDTKHISSVADGANVSTPTNITLGNLMISREDVKSTSTIAVDGSDLATYVVSLSSASDNIYKTIGGSDTYRYDRAYLKTPNNALGYLNKQIFDVADSDGTSPTIKITIPQKSWTGARTSTAILSTDSTHVNNGYTNTVHDRTIIQITPSNGDIDGVKVGHYLRMVDTTGTPSIELHDKILKVVGLGSNYIDVDLDQLGGGNTAPSFTAGISSDLAFINHGVDSTGDSHLQVYAPDNQLTYGVTSVELKQTGAGGQLGAGANVAVTIDHTDISANTFIITNLNNPMPIATNLDEIAGTYFPTLLPSYTAVAVHPVLAIDLSGDTSLEQACARVNTSTVSIPAVSTDPSTIFANLRQLPQTDGSFNAVYFSQRPGFSSVSAGGLEFVLHEDKNVATCSTLGLTAGEYNRNNSTVKAKLERWMNSLVNSRDVQLFTKVFHGGSQYATFPYDDTNSKSLYNGKTGVPNHFTSYDVEIDNTYNELFFSSREEAGNFNTLVNNLYAVSTFDKTQDTTNGTKGLINLKNNLEIQTREAASFGEKLETYESLEVVTILESNDQNDVIISLDASVYNTFVIDYTITETAGLPNKYLRMGTMQISARPDWTTSPTTAVVFGDRFSSSWDLTHSNPVVEPKFEATMNGNFIELKMDLQYSDPANPTVGQEAVHTLQSTLRMKYVAKRWSSTS